jgi:hypothetical protein
MAHRPRDPSTRTLTGVAIFSTIALGVMFRAPPRPQPGPVLHVPHVPSPPVIDGSVDEPAWRGPLASTGTLPNEDSRKMTDSSVRAIWSGQELFLVLYAADDDIRATVTTPDAPLWQEDAFRVAFAIPGDPRLRVIYVSPLGTLTDAYIEGDAVDMSWQSGARVGCDVDGTMNDPRDDDEEWVVEMAVPLASIGLRGVPGERVGFSVRRCDAPKGQSRRCGAWGEKGGQIELGR